MPTFLATTIETGTESGNRGVVILPKAETRSSCEYGPHECGKDTRRNIVLNRDTDPLFVIKFIEGCFDLKGPTSEKTIPKGPAVWLPSSL
jgi:hypothetical protein